MARGGSHGIEQPVHETRPDKASSAGLVAVVGSIAPCLRNRATTLRTAFLMKYRGT